MNNTANGKLNWGEVLRELGAIAGISCLLLYPILALKAVDKVTGIEIEPRYIQALWALVFVVIGRLGLILDRHAYHKSVLSASIIIGVAGFLFPIPFELLRVILIGGSILLAIKSAIGLSRASRHITQAQLDKSKEIREAKLRKYTQFISIFVVIFALFLPFMPFANRYVLDVSTLIFTYVMLAWGLNIIVGYAGLLDLGYVAFYAIGAYTYAILSTTLGLSFWLCLPLSGLFAALGGLILGFPVLKLRGDYFAIVTLGFGEIIRVIIINWTSFTHGAGGISSIARPDFFGLAVFAPQGKNGLPSFAEFFGIEYSSDQRIIFLYYLIFTMAMLVAIFTVRIRKLPIGRAWEALREDDLASASLGINRTNIKLAAFAISAMWGGFAGAFFATRQGFVSPESFAYIESAIILAIVVMGGMGSLTGVALAAIALIGLPEVFRDLAEYRMVSFGLGLVVIMIFRPQGLISHREPSVSFFTPKNSLPLIGKLLGKKS